MLAAALFSAGLLFVLYVLFGYPLLLALIARLRPRAVHKSRQRKTVSVLIAVYNGEQFMAAKLRSVLALDYPRELMEVLVVSDGSTDATDSIVESFAAEGVRLLRVPRGGKCAALNAGIAACGGEILALTDVRQTLAPDSLQHLVDCFADPAVGVVSGELVIRQGQSEPEAALGLYWRYEFWIRDRLSRIDSIFGATGSYCALRRELAVPIPPEMLLDDMYLPLAAFFRGYRLIVEPRARAFDYPASPKTEFRRKVRTLAGNYQILRAYPALLTPRNRMWFHFLSYKLGRLLLPAMLLLMVVTALLLPPPWRWLAAGCQAAFYGLAALDLLIPEGAVLKRLSAPARAFVVFMIAAACAVAVFFVPPQRLWKVTSAGG
ncbi:MAG: glycosyltransferase family 2 protein [Acidobacteriota bacterium]